MKIKTNLYLFLIVANYLMSCSDNQIYFDKTEQSIKTCNAKYILNLSIDDLDGNYSYLFEKIKGKKGTNSFSLVDLNKNYRLELLGQRQDLPFDSFNLKPKTVYKISNHTYGDAARNEIKVVKNEMAKIIATDVTSCQ